MLTADGPEGARVQLPLRRPRDAGGAAAAALRPRRPLPAPPASPAASPASRPTSRPTGRSRSSSPPRGYPESSSKGDVIDGVAAAEATGAEVTHAGTAIEDGRARHRRRSGPQRDRARARRRDRAGARIRCRRADHIRRPADPDGHRRPRRRANHPGGLMTEAESDPLAHPGDRNPSLPEPGVDARRRDRLRGDRGRLAAGRDHHGIGERQAEDAAGRQGPRGRRHPLRGPGDERPSQPRHGRRVLQGRADARAEGDHRRRRHERGAARASPPPTRACR